MLRESRKIGVSRFLGSDLLLLRESIGLTSLEHQPYEPQEALQGVVLIM